MAKALKRHGCPWDQEVLEDVCRWDEVCVAALSVMTWLPGPVCSVGHEVAAVGDGASTDQLEDAGTSRVECGMLQEQNVWEAHKERVCSSKLLREVLGYREMKHLLQQPDGSL